MSEQQKSQASAKYEYHLHIWGSLFNDDILEKELGIKGDNFWFDTPDELVNFLNKVRSFANDHGRIVMDAVHVGYDVRKKTIAEMVFVLPNGKEYPYTYDFGYGYPLDGAHYMFHDGDYGCDCDRTLFLSRVYPEVDSTVLECGETITMKDFKVSQVLVN